MAPHQAPRLRALTTLVMLLALSACGGSGDGAAPAPAGESPAPPPPGGSGTMRIASISHDLDNNGTPDATETATYDTAGRVVGSLYDYTGDGTADRLEGMGARDLVSTFTYDAAGRIATNTQMDSTFSFIYAAGEQLQYVDISTGGLTGRFDFTYDAAGLMTRSETTVAGSVIGFRNYEHDAAGRRTRMLEGTPGDPSVLQTLYTWNSDNTLAAVARDLDADGRDVRYEMTYAGGRQTGTRKSVGGVVGYTVRFEYDAGGRLVRAIFDAGADGSDDATWTLSWASGACQPQKLPFFDPLLNSITGWGSSVTGTVDRCGPA